MHDQASFNFKLLSAGDISISSRSSAALYGKGIFTTIAIHNGQPFLWEKHWNRLWKNAQTLKIDLAEFSERAVKDALDKILDNNGVVNGRSRLTFFDGSASSVWPSERPTMTSLFIMTADQRTVPGNFRLSVSPYRVNSLSPLAGIKSCNYLEKIIALDDARSRGFDEAIQINERGEITSAATANVFWLRDDILYTPHLKTGCLSGTTREFVLENLGCREVEATVDNLHSADAIFLTSAGLGVVQIAEFESRQFARIGHPILDLPPKRA